MNKMVDTARTNNAVAPEETGDAMGLFDSLHQRIGSQKYNAWFRHGTRISLEDGLVKVCVPNPFVANWIESHYVSEIAASAHEKTGVQYPVLVMVDPMLSGSLRKSQLDSQAQQVELAATGKAKTPVQVSPQSLRYKMGDFVVGQSNRLAHSAAVAVGSGQKVAFNPLFIHGPCGVGKTHLLQGICDLAGRHSQCGKPLAWRYVTGEQFTNEFITALRHKKVDEFRARYRKLELLAIDDVHFLAAKRATQDEFLHTFNAIESSGKQIIMASDAHPRMVGDLNEQLVSRFLAGMVVKVNVPDQAMRVEILRRKAKHMRLEVPEDVMEYVGTHVRGSVRELEGALLRISAIAALNAGVVTLELAGEALADHLARTDSAVTLGDIEATVSAFFGITSADIHSSRRTRTVSVARMIAMFLARRHTRMSYPEIGKAMGKNHSSAVLAVQRMEELLAKDAQVDWMSPAGTKSMAAGQLVQMLAEQIS